jgi:hypothetical protein
MNTIKKKNALLVVALVSLFGIISFAFKNPAQSPKDDKKNIGALLDEWHKAAATANYNNYFRLMADNAIFIGTDATENWNKKNFMIWAKPYFDRGRAWSFTSLERNIYFDKTGNTAWFDELLNTQMKICRGSGVVTREGKTWRIQQYVLSMTIPNDKVDSVIKIKGPIEDALINKLLQKQ